MRYADIIVFDKRIFKFEISHIAPLGKKWGEAAHHRAFPPEKPAPRLQAIFSFKNKYQRAISHIYIPALGQRGRKIGRRVCTESGEKFIGFWNAWVRREVGKRDRDINILVA